MPIQITERTLNTYILKTREISDTRSKKQCLNY